MNQPSARQCAHEAFGICLACLHPLMPLQWSGERYSGILDNMARCRIRVASLPPHDNISVAVTVALLDEQLPADIGIVLDDRPRTHRPRRIASTTAPRWYRHSSRLRAYFQYPSFHQMKVRESALGHALDNAMANDLPPKGDIYFLIRHALQKRAA